MAKKAPEAPKKEAVVAKAIPSNPGEISTGKRDVTTEDFGSGVKRETF